MDCPSGEIRRGDVAILAERGCAIPSRSIGAPSGDPIPMRAIFTDGEPIYPFLREKLEAAFAVKLHNTYGNTELCGLIQQCEAGGACSSRANAKEARTRGKSDGR